MMYRSSIIIWLVLLCACHSDFDISGAKTPVRLSTTELNDLEDFNQKFLTHLGTMFSRKEKQVNGVFFDESFLDLQVKDFEGTPLQQDLYQLRTTSLAVDRIIFREDSVVRYVLREMVDHNNEGWSRSYTHEVVFNPRKALYGWYQCEKFNEAEIKPKWYSVAYACNVGH